MNFDIPKFPLAHIIDVMLNWLTSNFSFITQAFSHVISAAIDGIVTGLLWLPPWLLIIVRGRTGLAHGGSYAWRSSRRSGCCSCGTCACGMPTIQTFTLVLISTLIAVVIGLPLGIGAALSKRTSRVVMPVLDFMQTMPAFVYLIPAIPFFGLGAVSASVATVIFSMPPAIRLTALGISQVPADLIEAADAFGSTPRRSCSRCSCRWPCRPSWPASTRPSCWPCRWWSSPP